MNSAKLLLAARELAVVDHVLHVTGNDEVCQQLQSITADLEVEFSPDVIATIDAAFTSASAIVGFPRDLAEADQVAFHKVKATFAAAAVD